MYFMCKEKRHLYGRPDRASAARQSFFDAIAEMTMTDIKADLASQVVELGLQGFFHRVATEEAANAKNPNWRGNASLKLVFGTT